METPTPYDLEAHDLPAYNNLGRVRPIDGLGTHSDRIDCPHCQKATMTYIEMVPSEQTR